MAIDLSRLLIFWKTRDCGQNRFEPIRLLRKSNFSLSSKIARGIATARALACDSRFPRDSIGWPEFSAQ
jgi:hypothetical protein